MPIHHNSERLDRLHALDKAREELLQEFNRALPSHWNIDLGRFHIPVRLASTGLSWLYVSLDAAAFGFGIACIFLGQSWRELGVALVVGAMFGISTFVGQLLGIQLSVEEHRLDLLWRDELTKAYAVRLAEIDEQRRVLDDDIGLGIGTAWRQ
jgi:hypothetical protein